MSAEGLGSDDIRHLLIDGFVPFAEVNRAIPWPNKLDGWENDAEHSWALAVVAGSVADRLGLDANKAAAFGLMHDFVERYAGDTSIWDEELAETKEQREDEALEEINTEFPMFPWLGVTISDYESLDSEEACLVYALDKLLAIIMLMETDGYYWKTHGISYEDHVKKYVSIKEKISKHPVVSEWYEELIAKIRSDRPRYFDS